LKIIVKADTQGTLEAIEKSLRVVKSERIHLEILSADVGNISEKDIKFAHSAKASIFGFKVKAAADMQSLAEQFGVKIFTFDVIYELIEAAEKEMVNLLEPQVAKTTLGRLKVLAIFKDSEKSQIVGGRVTTGFVKKGARVAVLREDKILGEGVISQLQQNKLDTQQVSEGSECGLMIALERSTLKIAKGDMLEVFEQKIIQPALTGV